MTWGDFEYVGADVVPLERRLPPHLVNVPGAPKTVAEVLAEGRQRMDAEDRAGRPRVRHNLWNYLLGRWDGKE